jgi:hypothetical protein
VSSRGGPRGSSRPDTRGGEVDPPEGPGLLNVRVEAAEELMCKASGQEPAMGRTHSPHEACHAVFGMWLDVYGVCGVLRSVCV